MKTKSSLVIFTCLNLNAFGQTIDTNSFFEPDFMVRRYGTTNIPLALTVTNDSVDGTASHNNVTWTHAAGGHAQVHTSLEVIVPLANLDAQLAAYTRTMNDSLIFGREITTEVELLGVVDVGPTLQSMVNEVAGAGVLYSWESNVQVAGLSIVPDQLYQVDFDITSGSGLPVNLLSSSTFGITTTGISGASNESAETLNLLNLITLGADTSTGHFSFQFKSDQNLNSLDFAFAASTGVGVSLLGGTSGNQNVLTFSGFQVTQIPEPRVAALLALMGVLPLFARNRRI